MISRCLSGVLGTLLLLAAPSARAQPAESHSVEGASASRAEPGRIDEREALRELRALRARAHPVLREAGAMTGAGVGVVAVGWLAWIVVAVAEWDAAAAGMEGSPLWHATRAAAALSAIGGALVVAGLVWLIERAGPYAADAPRRDRIVEIRRRLRDLRQPLSVLPELRLVSSGALAGVAIRF